MGDRGCVKIVSSGVVLYTHWGASALPETVAAALSNEVRWNDPSYLARIIFDEMTGLSGTATGHGIMGQVPGDAWRVLAVHVSGRNDSLTDGSEHPSEVDCSEREIHFEEGYGYATGEYEGETFGFEEFIDNFHES